MLSLLVSLALATVQSNSVDLEIVNTKFRPQTLTVPPGKTIRLINRDRVTYTLEGPGLLYGDVLVEPNSEQILIPAGEAGNYVAVLEEHPSQLLRIILQGPARVPADSQISPFAEARESYRQPVLSRPGRDPAYAAFTAFDFAQNSESARQIALQKLYLLAEELDGATPPPELAPFFTAQSWREIRTSISLIIGLGPSAYDAKRFGARVAMTKPQGLHEAPFRTLVSRKPSQRGQRDVMIRVASNSHWLNLRIARLVWRRLSSAVSRPSLASGYANPNGRSPILGGFFDGTGNPSGALREKVVFRGRNDTFMTFFKIQFDESRFLARSLGERQAAIGRERQSGKQLLKAPASAHRNQMKKYGMDILRQPVIFDEGPDRTGLLFVSFQANLRQQFEAPFLGILKSKALDPLMSFMHFEEAAYYYIPASNHGSYPGSLRDRP